jgi:hypothetical protein
MMDIRDIRQFSWWDDASHQTEEFAEIVRGNRGFCYAIWRSRLAPSARFPNSLSATNLLLQRCDKPGQRSFAFGPRRRRVQFLSACCGGHESVTILRT